MKISGRDEMETVTDVLCDVYDSSILIEGSELQYGRFSKRAGVMARGMVVSVMM